MRQAVNVYRSPHHAVVESTSLLVGRGRVANGWALLLRADVPEADLGRAVLDGIRRSGAMEGTELPVVAPGSTVASAALGYGSDNAMLAAGVSSAIVGVKDGFWKVTPMINDGPGHGFGGRHEAPPATHDGPWDPSALGAAVRAALDAAAALGYQARSGG